MLLRLINHLSTARYVKIKKKNKKIFINFLRCFIRNFHDSEMALFEQLPLSPLNISLHFLRPILLGTLPFLHVEYCDRIEVFLWVLDLTPKRSGPDYVPLAPCDSLGRRFCHFGDIHDHWSTRL